MASKVLTFVLAVAVLMLISAQSASWDQLSDEVDELQDRVERLEALAVREDPYYLDGAIVDPDRAPPPREDARATPDRIMRLEGVETIEPDPESYDELDRLRKEADALEKTVENSQRKVNSMTRGAGGGSGYRSRSSKSSGQSRQRRGEAEMLANYQKKLREKQGEVKRMERELEEPKQIIVGRYGNKVITLESSRDLSRYLDKMSLGEYVTWEGRRIRADTSSQDWVITSIKATSAPE